MSTVLVRKLACDGCGTPLSGGVDTFGEPGQQLCFGCFMSPNNTDGMVSRSEFLNTRKEQLNQWLEYAEDDKREAVRHIADCEDRIAAIDRELSGKGKCDEEDED